MEKKTYVSWRATNAYSEPERIVKTEEELTQQDFDLYLGHLLNEFKKAPKRSQEEFLNRVKHLLT